MCKHSRSRGAHQSITKLLIKGEPMKQSIISIPNANTRVLIVPDLHTNWWVIQHLTKIAKKKRVDWTVFLGDYVDDFDDTPGDNLAMLAQLDLYRREHAPEVVFLLGNHEASYLWDKRCSGWTEEKATVLRPMLERMDLHWAFKLNNWTFSHAGISRGWLETCKRPLAPTEEELYAIGPTRNGFALRPGPLWMDKEEFYDEPSTKRQVVGHTPLHRENTVRAVKMYPGGREVHFCDNRTKSQITVFILNLTTEEWEEIHIKK